MNVLQFVAQFKPYTHEAPKQGKPGDCSRWVASNSEIKRWIAAKNVKINGEICTDPYEEVDFPITSFVLFPGAKSQCTFK